MFLDDFPERFVVVEGDMEGQSRRLSFQDCEYLPREKR